MSASPKIRRYPAKVAPSVFIEIVYEDSAGLCYKIRRQFFDEEYGWTRKRRNMTREWVERFVRETLAKHADPGATVISVRVTQESLVWWTPPEKKEGE